MLPNTCSVVRLSRRSNSVDGSTIRQEYLLISEIGRLSLSVIIDADISFDCHNMKAEVTVAATRRWCSFKVQPAATASIRRRFARPRAVPLSSFPLSFLLGSFLTYVLEAAKAAAEGNEVRNRPRPLNLGFRILPSNVPSRKQTFRILGLLRNN